MDGDFTLLSVTDKTNKKSIILSDQEDTTKPNGNYRTVHPITVEYTFFL